MKWRNCVRFSGQRQQEFTKGSRELCTGQTQPSTQENTSGLTENQLCWLCYPLNYSLDFIIHKKIPPAALGLCTRCFFSHELNHQSKVKVSQRCWRCSVPHPRHLHSDPCWKVASRNSGDSQQRWKLVSVTLQLSQVRSFYFLSKRVAKATATPTLQQLTNTNLIKIFLQKSKSELISGMKCSKENVQIPALSNGIGVNFLLVSTHMFTCI